MKESFAAFTCTVMEMLVEDAPAIGSDNNAFNSKVNLPTVFQYSIMFFTITAEILARSLANFYCQ